MKYICAGLLAFSFGVATAIAEAPFTGEIVTPDRDPSCSASHARVNSKGFFGGETKRGTKEGRGPETERLHALQAAYNGLMQGYNYAMMEPLKITLERDYQEVVVYGWGEARKKMQPGAEYRVYHLGCSGVDDEAAFQNMWDPDAETDTKRTLVDLREFIRTIGGNSDPFATRPRNMAIADYSLSKPGDRERVLAQYDVKLAASRCTNSLRPLNQSNFKPDADDRNWAGERQCLEGLRAQAAAVGWDQFPLTKLESASTAASSGYTLNTPSSSSPSTLAAPQGPSKLPVDIWGEKWVDHTQKYPNFPGKIIANEGEIILMSNTLTRSNLIDYAVFEGAAHILQDSYNGLSLKDKTSEHRNDYNYKFNDLSKKSGRPLSRAQDDVADAELALQSSLEKRTREERLYASNPSAFRKEMLDAEIKFVKRAQDELNDAKSKLASLATGPIKLSASLSASQAKKARYYAFETYSNVLIIEAGALYPSQKTCADYYIVCADKMQAYNALGKKLNVADFNELSYPPTYKIWAAE